MSRLPASRYHVAVMRWKHSRATLSTAGILTLLLFVLAPVVSPTTGPPKLASASVQRVQSAASPLLTPPSLPGFRDAALLNPRSRAKWPSEMLYPTGGKGHTPAEKSTAEEPTDEGPALTEKKNTPAENNPASNGSLEFDLSSFNVLGSSHSAGGGTKSQMASGVTRIRWAASLLARHGVDVVGFQEFQLDQARAFIRLRGGTYDVYPGASSGGMAAQNSIAWRTDMWERVRAYTVPIHYFNGKTMPMPVVLLRHRATGANAYFTNFHNPASTRLHPNQERWRRLALLKEVALVNRLRGETGYPVFLTGDLNEKKEAFCTMTGRTLMVAANGGGNSGACRSPQPINIDWIFGSAGVTFSQYRADRSPLVSRTTDHPMIVSHVRIGGQGPGG